MKRLVIIIFLLCLWATPCFGAYYYWFDDTGTQTSAANCRTDNSTPPSGSTTNYCGVGGMSSVNSTVVAGDTVYFRAGTYTFSAGAINPTNEGTSHSARITFAGYPGETVIFLTSTAGQTCVNLKNGKSYITVRNIKCDTWLYHVLIGGTDLDCAEYNEIDSCIFTGIDIVVPPATVGACDWAGSEIGRNDMCGRYNWLHDSTFEKYGYFGGSGYDQATPLEIGYDTGVRSVEYNVIENNVIQYGGHHALGLAGYRNIIRNNYIQNNNWLVTGAYTEGCKVIHLLSQAVSTQGQHLLEGNRVSFGANNHDPEMKAEGEAILFSSHYDIVRYNVFDNNDQEALYIHDHGSGTDNYDNVIYNNTFWRNGYSICSWCDPNVMYQSMSHAVYDAPGGTYSNTYKNNLFYDNANTKDADYSIVIGCDYCPPSAFYPTYNTYANNYEGGVSGNPLFVNITGTPDADQRNQFDFNLQSGSPARDVGGYLTQTNNSGTGYTISVDESRYFQPGWGAWSSGGPAIYADWICVGTTVAAADCVQISSIDYTNHDITLTSSITWADDDYVWLYKKSDGTLVLAGAAPDAGAYEYTSTTPPSAKGLIMKGTWR